MPTYTDLPEQVGNDCRQRQMYNTKHKAGDSFLAQMEPHKKVRCLNRSCVRSFAGCADLNLAGRAVEEQVARVASSVTQY